MDHYARKRWLPLSHTTIIRTNVPLGDISGVLLDYFSSVEIMQELMSIGSSISQSSLCQQLLKTLCIASEVIRIETYYKLKTNLMVQNPEKYIYYST